MRLTHVFASIKAFDFGYDHGQWFWVPSNFLNQGRQMNRITPVIHDFYFQPRPDQVASKIARCILSRGTPRLSDCVALRRVSNLALILVLGL